MPDAFEKVTPPTERPSATVELHPDRERTYAESRAAAPQAELDNTETSPHVSLLSVTPVYGVAQPEPPDPVLASVERILSEDLFDLYRGLPPTEQARFKEKGEETASKIRELVTHATVKAKEILKLIIAWLALIPGVNKFFLEQESKIKTDKLLELHKRETNNS